MSVVVTYADNGECFRAHYNIDFIEHRSWLAVVSDSSISWWRMGISSDQTELTFQIFGFY